MGLVISLPGQGLVADSPKPGSLLKVPVPVPVPSMVPLHLPESLSKSTHTWQTLAHTSCQYTGNNLEGRVCQEIIPAVEIFRAVERHVRRRAHATFAKLHRLF